MKIVTCFALLLTLGLALGCARTQTYAEKKRWIDERILKYLDTNGYDPDQIELLSDEKNTDWTIYWEGQLDTMLAQDKLWHAQLYTIWVYRCVDLSGSRANIWVFVDRNTDEIKGQLKIH